MNEWSNVISRSHKFWTIRSEGSVLAIRNDVPLIVNSLLRAGHMVWCRRRAGIIRCKTPINFNGYTKMKRCILAPTSVEQIVLEEPQKASVTKNLQHFEKYFWDSSDLSVTYFPHISKFKHPYLPMNTSTKLKALLRSKIHPRNWGPVCPTKKQPFLGASSRLLMRCVSISCAGITGDWEILQYTLSRRKMIF